MVMAEYICKKRKHSMPVFGTSTMTFQFKSLAKASHMGKLYARKGLGYYIPFMNKESMKLLSK
jgi:hypothetical protein